MRHLSARSIVLACMAAIAALALAVPGTALAKKGDPNMCGGVNIEGKGASFQKTVQISIWTPQFNALKPSKTACNGENGTGGKPTVTYTSTGSGAGLKSWGIENEGSEIHFDPTNAYVATDDPPNAAQVKEVEKQESPETPESVLTIPVVQGADVVIMHLPTGCTATSTSQPGQARTRAERTRGHLRRHRHKWGELTAGGDKLTGAGCNEAKIQPAVRQDESGTTHIFQKFLGLINTGKLKTDLGELTWNQISEGANNTHWPEAAKVAKPEKAGNGELVALVAKEPGYIGYSDLATARGNKAFYPAGEGGTGGPGTATFWAPVENESKKGKPKFSEPSTNGEVKTAATANCKKAEYSNGENPFPPPTATEPWNEVTTKLAQKGYPLCGFSFILTFTKYSLVPSTTEGEVQTVRDYLKFVTDKKGGQALANVGDYAALPKSVLNIANENIPLIGF